MNKTNNPHNFLVVSDKIRGQTARYVAGRTKTFFKECFVNGGWTGDVFLPWMKSKIPLGRKLMYNEGSLMNSIRTIQESDNRVETGTTLQHAGIHNSGGLITVTAAMKRFWWAKYYEFAGKVKRTRRGEVAAESRKENAKADFCRRMALMKVGSKIKMPKRQFIGESATLMKQFDEWVKNTVETTIKNDLNDK